MAVRDLKMLGLKGFADIEHPPMPESTKRFLVTIRREADDPMGRVYCFNPL